MSITEPAGAGADFEAWLTSEFEARGSFTALVMLVRITETDVTPLCSTFLNVIGAEISWGELVALFAGAKQSWDGAAFFTRRDAEGLPLTTVAARLALGELEERIAADRLVLNDGDFFDAWGRRMKVEEVAPH